MPANLPNNIPPARGKFRVSQINAENLFLFFDEPLPGTWKSMTEKEWQKVSNATVSNKSLKKTLWLAQSLLEIDADIILVNEVGGIESLTNFAKVFLQDRYLPFVIEGNSDRGIDVGYLIRRDLDLKVELFTHKDRPLNFLYPHELESNKHFESTEPNRVLKSHYFSRDCAELRVHTNKSADLALVILLVHLKSKLDPDGIDPEGRARRAAELKSLVAIYNERRTELGAHVPMIVGGDFNGIVHRERGEKEFAPLFDRTDLENVFSILGLDTGQAMTQIQFQRSGPVQLLQIDYLFISPNLRKHLLADETFVYRYKSDLGVQLPLPSTLDQRLAMPSDHYPIVATFRDFLGIKKPANPRHSGL